MAGCAASTAAAHGRLPDQATPSPCAPQVMDHDTVLFFSPDGIARSLKAYQIPQSSRTAAGAPLSQVSSRLTLPSLRHLCVPAVDWSRPA